MTSYYKNGIKRLTKKALIAVLLGGRKMKQAWRNLGVTIGVVKKRAKKFVEAENVELKREVSKNQELRSKNHDDETASDSAVIPARACPPNWRKPESSSITTPTDDAGSRVKPGMTEGGVWNDKKKRKVSVEEFFNKNYELRSKNHEDETASDSAVIPAGTTVIPARACPPNWRKPESNEILNQVQDDNYDARDDKGGSLDSEFLASPTGRIIHDSNDDPEYSISAYVKNLAKKIFLEITAFVFYFLATLYKQIEPGLKSVWKVLEKYTQKFWQKFAQTEFGSWTVERLEPWARFFAALLKFLMRKVVALNTVQKVTAALVILAMLWTNGLFAFAQEGDPMDRISTPEIKALQTVNPELLHSDNLAKEKEIEKVIEQEEQKINYTFGGLVPDSDEDKVKKEEVKILQEVKDNLRGGIFVGPKSVEYTVLKFTKSYHPRVKQAAKNVQELLQSRGLFETIANYETGEEKELSTKLDYERGKIKPGSVPFNIDIDGGFIGGMRIGDISDQAELDTNSEIRNPNNEQITNDQASKEDGAPVAPRPREEASDETASDSSIIPSENTVIPAPEPESTTWIPDQVGNDNEIPDQARDDGGGVQDDNEVEDEILDSEFIIQDSASASEPFVASGGVGGFDPESEMASENFMNLVVEDQMASETSQNNELRIKNHEDETASGSLDSEFIIHDSNEEDKQDIEQSSDNQNVINQSNTAYAFTPKTYKIDTQDGEKFLIDKTPEHQESIEFIPVGANETSGITADNKVLFRNAWQGMDVLKTVTQQGVKEDIIIKNNSASTKVEFEVKTTGLQMRIVEGGLEFYDIFGNLKFETPAPFMVDRYGNAKNLEYKLVVDSPVKKVRVQNENQELRIKNHEDETASDSSVIPAENNVIPAGVYPPNWRKPESGEILNQVQDDNGGVGSDKREDETASDSAVIPSDSTVIPAENTVIPAPEPESTTWIPGQARDDNEILNQVQDDSYDARDDSGASQSEPDPVSWLQRSTNVILSTAKDLGSLKNKIIAKAKKISQSLRSFTMTVEGVFSYSLGKIKMAIASDSAEASPDKQDEDQAELDQNQESQPTPEATAGEARIKNQEDDETTNGTADTTVIPADSTVIPAPEPESTTWIPGHLSDSASLWQAGVRDDNEILNQVQDDNGGVGNDSYDARDDSGGTLDSEFIIHDSSGGSRQTKPIIDPNDTRNQIVQSISQNDGSQNKLTVFDDAVHQVAEIFGQGPQWVLSIFSDSQIQSILDMQAQLSGASSQTEVAQKDGKKLVLPEGWSDEILTSITEERTYKVVIELDFTGLSFPIDLDPTTYINLQDKGQVTFHADFSDGAVNGMETFANGYGKMDRGGNEAVQAGGTRVENTSSSITFVDPDGRRILGKSVGNNDPLAVNSIWYLQENGDASGGNFNYIRSDGTYGPDPSIEDAFIEFSFTGTEVWAGFWCDNYRRSAKVIIDPDSQQETETRLSFYLDKTGYTHKQLIATGLENTSHTVRIYPLPDTFPNFLISISSSPFILDYFEYYTSGNELAQKSSITINERATAGFNFLNSKDSPAISYSATGNVPQSDGGTEERGSFSTWISPDFDWNADNAPHYIWGDENQRLYYQYDSVGASGTFNYEIYNGSDWSTVRVESDEFSVASGTFSAGDVFHIATTWDASTGSALYVNNDKNTHSGSWTAQTVSGSFKFGGDEQTKLLLHADGANNATEDIDSSGNGASVTFNGDAKVSTASSTFGGASYYFDGTSDRVGAADSPNLEFGSEDFTIDLWVCPTTNNVTGREIIGKRNDASVGSFTFYQYGTVFYFYASSNGSAWDIATQKSLGSVDLNAWTHLSIVRSGNDFYAFNNGVQQDTWSSSSAIVDNSVPINIGATDGGGEAFQGYVDEVRVSRGIARWTSNFTLPDVASYSNMIISEPTLFNYALTDSEVKNIYSSTVSMGQLIEGIDDDATDSTQSKLFSAPRRAEETNQTSKSLLFNFPGVQTADSKVGSFGGSLYKTSAPTNPSTTVAEADVTFEGSWTDNGNLRYTTDASAYATYTTAGNATEIWAGVRASTDRAIAEYIIDEGTAKEVRVKVDQYASSATDRYYLLATGLESTTHTIKVRPLGIRNPSSSGDYIIVGLSATADRMFYYGTTGDIATQDMVVNGQTVNNVLTQDYATMPNAIQFTDKGNISESAHEGTISAWVQTSWAGNDSTNHFIFDSRDSSGLNGITLYKNTANNLSVYFANGSSNVGVSAAVGATNWAADTPHHVVAKWWRPTSTTVGLAIYLDGKKIAENKPQTFTPSSSSLLSIGTTRDAISESTDFDGAIYDLSVWSWAFDDGGSAFGDEVLPESDVWQSWKGRALLAQEDLSSQVDGTVATFKLLRSGLQQTYAQGDDDTYTKLLMHADGVNNATSDSDSSLYAHPLTFNGDAKVSTASSTFGGASHYFDGTGDYISAPDSDDWNFGSGDFTVDFWVNFNTLPSGTAYAIFSQYQDSNNFIRLNFWNSGSNYGFQFQEYLDGGTTNFAVGPNYSADWAANTWYHIALVRSGNDWAIYKNGTEDSSTTNSQSISDLSGSLNIGYDNGYYMNGYLDELRVSKNIARWTSSFTPETSPYEITSYTQNSLTSSMSVKDDGSLATVSSVASGTFGLASGSFDFDDTSIVVDNLDDENSIDTNGGYLTVGQPGANWQREIMQYSSYNAGTNTFTVSARGQKGTFATSWADNTPIEIGATITLSSAPEEDSILLADYYYTGSEFDRDRGQIKSKQNRLNFLDYTDSASTGWDLTGYSAYNSGGQRMATQVAGQNAFGYFYGSDLGLVFYGDGTNGGVAEFIIDEGTKDQRRVLVDQNDSNGSQAFLQVVAGLSAGYHTFRMIGGVAETNAGSNKYSTFDAVIFGGKTADLGQPTGNVGGDEYKDSNYVNDILYWPAWEDFGGTQEAQTVTLSGTLSGYYDYSEYDVVIGNVTVSAYTGSGLGDGTCDSGDTGCLEIDAKTIAVTGTINASGAGYGGGGGGGGGTSQHPAASTNQYVGGTGGSGVAGGSSGANGSGTLGDGSVEGRPGGNGGAGGGTYGGSGGPLGAGGPWGNGSNGSAGSKGGYATSQGQGDSSTDESLLPGSGGGGGGGGGGGSREICHVLFGGGAAGGGAGNRGGGFVKLYASDNLEVSGAINTTGKSGATGNGVNGNGTQSVPADQSWGTNGGSAASSGTSSGGTGSWGVEADCPNKGGDGGSGGAGAGGGVLLKAPTVSVSGSIDTRGGGNDTANGGTLKVFYDDAYDSGTYSTGRTYATTYTAPTSDKAIYLDADITGEAISSMVVDSASTSSLDFLSRPAGVVQIGTEYIKYETFSQSGASVTFQGITRGYSGSTAATHSSGDVVTVKGGWRDGSISQNWDWFDYFGAFPERPLLSTTGREGQVEGNLSVVNLDGNTLWGRFEAGASNAITSAPQTVAAANGKVFAGFGAGGGGLAEVDFMADRILRHKATAGVGYGSATGTKGLISQANDAQGWSYTSQTGVALIGTGGDYVNDVVANYNTTSSTYDVWVAQGKKGTTGTSAGVSYVFDSLTNGLLDTAYDLTADTGYWVSAVYYDADNDDLYIAQTKGTAGDDIWSKISNPRLTADSSIDTADGSDRVASASYTFEITGDADNVYFATADGVKKVSKSSFSSGVTDTFNASDYPELADGNDSYTKLLLHGDGYSSQTFEVDYSASQHELTFNGDAELSTDQKKFGVSSLRFDGTGDYISIPDSDDWNFGSGDFSVDFWVNFSSLPSVSGIYAIAGQYVDGDNYGWLWLQNNSGTLRWMYEVRSGAASQYPLTQDTTLSTNTWYHIAIVRSGNNWYCFQDGQQVGATGSNSVSVPDYAAPNLIGTLSSNYYLSGYLDELRISKGIARWTSNFTPPTEPHQMPAMSVDYSSELNRLINTFSGMVITTNTAGGDVNYYDSNTETDLDRNNNLSGSYFNRAIWTDYSGSNNGFAAGGDEGITLGVWEGMEDVGDVKSPGVTVWGGFMIF